MQDTAPSSLCHGAVSCCILPIHTSGRDKHLVVPPWKPKNFKNLAFYARYDAFHAMTDTNVTFPRSSHPFEESNNPHAIFTTCLPLKLLIHTHPSPVTLQKDTYNAVPLKLWAQTTRLLPPLHITSRQNNNKRRTNGEANAPHKRSPIPLASLFSELVPPNRDPEQEPAAAHLPCPALRSERRCCCCCCCCRWCRWRWRRAAPRCSACGGAGGSAAGTARCRSQRRCRAAFTPRCSAGASSRYGTRRAGPRSPARPGQPASEGRTQPHNTQLCPGGCRRGWHPWGSVFWWLQCPQPCTRPRVPMDALQYVRLWLWHAARVLAPCNTLTACFSHTYLQWYLKRVKS